MLILFKYTYHRANHKKSNTVVHISVNRGESSLCSCMPLDSIEIDEHEFLHSAVCFKCSRIQIKKDETLKNTNLRALSSLRTLSITNGAFAGCPLREVPSIYIEKYILEVESGEMAPFLNIDTNQLTKFLKQRYENRNNSKIRI